MNKKRSRTQFFEPVLNGSGWPISDSAKNLDLNFAHDVLGTLLDDKLGSGVSRDVFSLFGNDKHVAKIERPGRGYFANILEFTLWNDIKNTDLVVWFAPCRCISLGGMLLIQDRTEPMHPKHMPDRIPAFFEDVKLSNWGMLNGKPVCHDYSIHSIIERTSKAMKKANW